MQINEKPKLAIAAIPCQGWSGNLYEAAAALKKGTIFPELNMPFYVVDSPDTAAGIPFESECPKCEKQKKREELMCQINEISFFIQDLVLYLDTHENETEAVKLLQEKLEQRAGLTKAFAEQFYPLTADCMSKCENGESISMPGAAFPENQFLWSKGPLPWEGACV